MSNVASLPAMGAVGEQTNGAAGDVAARARGRPARDCCALRRRSCRSLR